MKLNSTPTVEFKTTLSNSFFRQFCPDPTVMYDLGDLYAELNALYFNGELPLLPCESYEDSDGETRKRYGTVKWDGRMGKKILGTYRPNGKGTGVIRLSRRIAQDPTLTRSVLLHEMLHKWLDLKGLDDGIRGHGPNFVSEAVKINKKCETRSTQYRIRFYEQEITREEVSVKTNLLDGDILLSGDLDVAYKMKTIAKAAFDESFIYLQ